MAVSDDADTVYLNHFILFAFGTVLHHVSCFSNVELGLDSVKVTFDSFISVKEKG